MKISDKIFTIIYLVKHKINGYFQSDANKDQMPMCPVNEHESTLRVSYAEEKKEIKKNVACLLK